MSAFIKMPTNEVGRDFVVGDIHGCYDQLEAALSAVSFDKEKDRLFSVGDLIDRGPDSLKCLNLVFEPWFFAVRGNHEEMMFAALLSDNKEARDGWFNNGGDWIYDHDHGDVKAIAVAASDLMPYAIEVMGASGTSFGIIHADVPDSDWASVQGEMSGHDKAYATWSRTRASGKDSRDIKGIDVVFMGHTIFKCVTKSNNALFIDTGAFTKNGKLTLLRLR